MKSAYEKALDPCLKCTLSSTEEMWSAQLDWSQTKYTQIVQSEHVEFYGSPNTLQWRERAWQLHEYSM